MNIYSYLCFLIRKINMDTISIEKIQRMAEVLKTIGHPLRLEVMQVLEQEEPLSVSEIKGRVGLDVEQSLLSHHLIKMKDKRVLKSEKQGMHVMYFLADRHILNIFECMQNCDIA